MDFIDQLHAIAARIPKQCDLIQTEEATKTAFVLPLISALGYNVFDPTEVVPEFTADVGSKKGEKVDYAIFQDGKPIIIFECKWCGADLDKSHASQLYRYFTVTEARVAVLTNGVIYRMYTDLEEPNKMDAKPFMEFSMLDLHERDVHELKRLSKSSFDVDDMLSAASDLKFKKEIGALFAQQLSEPDEEFVRFFCSRVYSGRLTKQIREQFAPIIVRALQGFIRDAVNERLQSALNQGEDRKGQAELAEDPTEDDPAAELAKKGIVTTEEEIEGFRVVRAIAAAVVDPGRVVMRDTKSYCGILLDDNNRKPICRLRFESTQKYLVLLDEEKNEKRVPIDQIRDIYSHGEQIRQTIQHYES